MEFDKAQLLEMLRARGDHQTAQQADGELPDKVDTQAHAGLLQKFGLDPQELIAKLGQGGGLGGLLGG